MKWPKSVSPYEVVIIPNINKNNNQSLEKAMKIYEDLKRSDIDVLIDDVNENMSSKFKKHDLIGIPFQIIIGSKSLNDKFEFKEVGLEPVLLNLKEIKNKLKNKIV